ncbi:unnamed protein product [Effrenium voratum]|nr:unnamed protein product [Effrenium voratum]
MDDALDSLHVASKAQTRQGQARLFPQNRRYTRSRERTASCPWHGFCSSTLWPAENGHAEFLTMQSRRSLFWETPVCARSPQLAERLQVSCELPFFRALRTRLGREVPNRVVPLQLVLPSLPAAAEEEHKELAAAQLLRGAELALEEGLFSERPEVPSLFSQPGASRAAFDKLWWQQTQEELVREAIHGPDDEKVKLHMAKRVFACKYAHQLMRRFLRIKNTKKRKLRIAQLDELVQSKVAEKFQGTERAAPTKHGLDEREDPVRVLQGGFHPDLVFLKPGLAENQRREAIRRVCGMNLASDADFWLLENLWKAMRSVPPPVPIVIAESEYRAHGSGFIQLPFDFTVPRLCDFLEEHLDAARAALVSRKARRNPDSFRPTELME